MKRDRSMTVRGAHADELIKKGLSEDDVRKIVNESTPTTNIPTGALPQPTTPYLVASRINNDGKVEVAVGFTTIASNLKRFAITHRLRRKDGTYGKPRRQSVPVTPAMIASGSGGAAQVILDKDWNPNRQVDLLLIEGKFVTTPDDDGGGSAQFPDPYVEVTSPPPPTLIASFLTGASQTGPEADNEILNSKFNWSRFSWDDDGGPANELAKWRHGLPTAFGGNAADPIVDNATSTARNYWNRTGAFGGSGVFMEGGSLVLYRGGAVSAEDVCARLQQRPFDAGEPFNMQFIMKYAKNFTAFDPIVDLVATLEDSVVGVIATTTYTGINANPPDNNFDWRPFAFPETFVNSGYTPSAASQQWVRFRLTGQITNSRLAFDKIAASHMPGAYRAHPKDRSQTNPPDVTNRGGVGRGTAGYGTTGAEGPIGGQRGRISTE